MANKPFLFALIPVYNDEWVIGFSARAALRWCDGIVLLDRGSTDRSMDIIQEIASDHPDQVSILIDYNKDKKDSEILEPMLREAEEKGATHIVVLSAHEILSSNLFRIRDEILGFPEGNAFRIPYIRCWKGFDFHRTDRPFWGGQLIPFAFRSSPTFHYKSSSGSERLPWGPQWIQTSPVREDQGGLLDLENVFWRRSRAKYYWKEMQRVIKKPDWKRKVASGICMLDEANMKIAPIREEWWDGYTDIIGNIDMSEISFYEKEVTRLIERHGSHPFSDIHMPGEAPNNELKNAAIAASIKKQDLRPATSSRVPVSLIEKKVDLPIVAVRGSLAWSGHLYDYSGYGKANREFLFRLANTFHISIPPSELDREPVLIDKYLKSKVDVHRSLFSPDGCPLLRFFGPREESHRGRRICFTMMETYGTHHDLVRLLNQNYDEVWVPTEWNKEIFKQSGVNRELHVVPLGINPFLFYPGKRGPLPEAKLLTTERAGKKEAPEGFLFINTSNPSFRKGLDVIIKSFEDAFAGNPHVALVLAVSYSSLVHCDPFALIPGGAKMCKTKIYVLEGKMTEIEVADMYRSCDAYVTASRGEGWNLPLMEAAACGLPTIAPLAFSHNDFLTEENCFLFNPDGVMTIPGAEKISPWYKDQLFTSYGEKSMKRLSELMREAFENEKLSKEKASRFRDIVLSKYTWDTVSAKAAELLLRNYK